MLKKIGFYITLVTLIAGALAVLVMLVITSYSIHYTKLYEVWSKYFDEGLIRESYCTYL